MAIRLCPSTISMFGHLRWLRIERVVERGDDAFGSCRLVIDIRFYAQCVLPRANELSP